MMKINSEEKTDIFCSVFAELKSLGVKVPKEKKFKSSIPKQAKPVSTSTKKIFGISISEQEKISVEDYLLPKFIVTATSYLKKFIDKEVGIFRKAGSVSRQRDLRIKLERGESIENSEPNDVASLLKQWLRELPEPLIPGYLHDLFIRCLNLQVEDNKVAAILLCCHLLPVDHFCTLKHLLDFLSSVAKHCDKNKMGAPNLALIMAPNIFVMGNDSIDKSSNGLVQQHTSVIKLLIINAHRVGAPCSSPHLAEAEALKSDNDLDLSVDVLDYSPYKSKKKRRSGPVQDLFTGFKKFVGQNSISPGRKRSNQESFNSDTRSAFKRKADDDHLPSMSPHKKQAMMQHEEASSSTPNNKIPKTVCSTSEKSRKGHSRHRSFNLLKRKEKKRQKTLISNALDSKLTASTPNSCGENILSLQVAAENKSFILPPSLSPINFENIFAKANFMKKSMSDCNLTPGDVKFQNKFFSTLSEGCLPVEGITPAYCFRPTTIAKRTIISKPDGSTSKTDSFISSPKYAESDKENSIPCPSVRLKGDRPIAKRSSPRALNSKVVNTSLNDIKCNQIKSSSTLKDSDQTESMIVPNIVIQPAISYDKINENLEVKKSALASAAEKSVSDINISRSNVKDVNGVLTIAHSNGVSSAVSKLRNDIKVKRNCSINRQEAFIFKPKNSRKTTLNQLKRADSIKISKSRYSRTNNQNDISVVGHKNVQKSNSELSVEGSSNVKSIESAALCNVSDKKRIKRNVRNGSIVRGRPNTVKTGLPTEICIRYSSDSASGNSMHKALSSSSSVDNDLFIDVVKKSEKNDPNLSIIHQIEKLTLSPNDAQEYASKIEVSNYNDFLQNEESKTEISSSDFIAVSDSVNKTASGRNFTEADIVKEVNVTTEVMKLKDPESIKSSESDTVKLEADIVNEVSVTSKIMKPKDPESVESSESNTEKLEADTVNEVSVTSKIAKLKDPESVKSSESNTVKLEADTSNKLSVTNKIVKLKNLESVKTENLKIVSERKSRERLCSNSDSKVQKSKKKSTKVSRINSFPDRVVTTKSRKVEKLRAVKSSSPRKSKGKKDKISGNTDKENQRGEESQKQAYLDVKTPEDKGKSPEQWYSGREFFEQEEASRNDICDHKRESIAMILKNNPGHVRAKASIYDCRSRTTPSSSTTPMMLSTPAGKYDSQYSNIQSSQKKSMSARSARYARRNSPLPPPPKFVMPDSSPVSSYPLKELTNLSNSEDIFFTPPSAQKSFNSSQNGENSSNKKKKCTLKPKMNSYSGHTPFKLPVDRSKVSRSESSPFLLNVSERTPRKSADRLSVKSSSTKCRNPSSKENYHSSPVFKTRSALSIERLKSDELLDEWNCEM